MRNTNVECATRELYYNSAHIQRLLLNKICNVVLFFSILKPLQSVISNALLEKAIRCLNFMYCVICTYVYNFIKRAHLVKVNNLYYLNKLNEHALGHEHVSC